MVLLYLAAVLCVLVPAVLTPVLAAGPARALAGGAVAGRLRAAADGLVHTLGRRAAALVVLLASSAAVIAVCWPLGEVLAAGEHAIDEPVLRFVQPRTGAGVERLALAYTALGDRAPLRAVSLVAAVGLAVLWRRRWWIPVVAMLGQFALEQYVQQILAAMVDRGHPPTGLGTYPSGGVARIVLTFGTLAVLACLTWRPGGRLRTAMAAAVAVAATVEGWTRIYVGKHWLTDVVGGLVFGPLLLLGVAGTLVVLAGPRPGGGPVRRGTPDAAPDAAAPVSGGRRR